MTNDINPYTGKPYNEGKTEVQNVVRIPIIGGWREERTSTNYVSPTQIKAPTPTPQGKMVTRKVLINGQWVESLEPENLGGAGGSSVQFSRIGSPKIETIPVKRILRPEDEGIGVEDEKMKVSRVLKPTASMKGGGVLYGTDIVALAESKGGGIIGASRRDLFRNRTTQENIIARDQIVVGSTSQGVMATVTPEVRAWQKENTKQTIEPQTVSAKAFDVLTNQRGRSYDIKPGDIERDIAYAGSGIITGVLSLPKFMADIIRDPVKTLSSTGKSIFESASHPFYTLKSMGANPSFTAGTLVGGYASEKAFAAAIKLGSSSIQGVFEKVTDRGPGPMRGSISPDAAIELLKKKRRLSALQQQEMGMQGLTDDILSGESVNQYYEALLKKKRLIGSWQAQQEFAKEVVMNKQTSAMLDILKLKKKGFVFTNPEMEFTIQPQQNLFSQTMAGLAMSRILQKQEIPSTQAQWLRQDQAMMQQYKQMEPRAQRLQVYPVSLMPQPLVYQQKQVLMPSQIMSQNQSQYQRQQQRQEQRLVQQLKQEQVQMQKQVTVQKQVQSQVQQQKQVQKLRLSLGLNARTASPLKQPFKPRTQDPFIDYLNKQNNAFKKHKKRVSAKTKKLWTLPVYTPKQVAQEERRLFIQLRKGLL